jgi:alpha-ribazole phosphatase
MGLFYLLRHGETEWNAQNRFCGRTDVPLSDAGRRQAHRLGERLKSMPIEVLYSSPLKRALETARVISGITGLKPTVDERLAEINYGQWEGKTLEEILKDDPAVFRAWSADPGRVAPAGGESGIEAQQRVVPFLDELARKHRGQHVAVVFHKTVCRLAVCHFLGMSPSDYRRRLTMDNTALNIVLPCEDGWQLVTYNDISHLSLCPPLASLGQEF